MKVKGENEVVEEEMKVKKEEQKEEEREWGVMARRGRNKRRMWKGRRGKM